MISPHTHARTHACTHTYTHTHTHTQTNTYTRYLFSQISLVSQVESSSLHKKHHNIDSDGHKLVVGSKGLILQRWEKYINTLTYYYMDDYYIIHSNILTNQKTGRIKD